jgi:HPt (histidine-containing phosphotransfer) domain-containing protein
MEFAMKIPESLRKKYIEHRAHDAEDLAVSLEGGRFDVLARVGHQLRGNASTYGYEHLADLGRKMEHAVESGSLTEGKECLYSLKAWLSEQQSGVGEDG